jgi:hypothetical protein
MIDFRCIYLPYCLVKQKNGNYLVLNLNYKPLGFATNDFLQYEDYPIEVKFRGLTKIIAAKLSWKESGDVEKIFLYNDGCIPTVSEEHMKKYLKKLKILAKLEIEDMRYRW